MNTVTESGAGSLKRPADFHKQLAALFAVNFTVEPDRSTPFQAEIRAWSASGYHLANVACTAHKTWRTLAPGAVAGNIEYFLFNLQLEGNVRVSQDGRDTDAGPGDIYLVNTSRDFTLETEDLVARSVYVPADRFRAACPEVDFCVGSRIIGKSGPGKMAADFLASVFSVVDDLTLIEAEHSVEALPHILAAALHGYQTPHIQSTSRIRDYHRARAKAFARRCLRDTQLNCRMIANALSMSQRYVYDLFSDEPLTLMRWILSERLEQCRKELGSPALRGKSVGEIAFSWGFIQLAHFSRAFTAAHGISPRAYRCALLDDKAQQQLN